MKDQRYLWVIERVLRDGEVIPDEMAYSLRDDARRRAKYLREYGSHKVRVVKYVPEGGKR